MSRLFHNQEKGKTKNSSFFSSEKKHGTFETAQPDNKVFKSELSQEENRSFYSTD